jgi:hypothetical protein
LTTVDLLGFSQGDAGSGIPKLAHIAIFRRLLAESLENSGKGGARSSVRLGEAGMVCRTNR